jgi:hypothetical protein
MRRVKEFIAEWETLDEWLKNYFVTTFKDELREKLEHIEAQAGVVDVEFTEVADNQADQSESDQSASEPTA